MLRYFYVKSANVMKASFEVGKLIAKKAKTFHGAQCKQVAVGFDLHGGCYQVP